MATLKEQIEAVIVQFWDEIALEEAALPEGVEKFPDTLDSPSAVDVLLALDEVVGFDLEPHEVIRRGGYDSKTQFIEHLTASVLKCVDEHKARAKK